MNLDLAGSYSTKTVFTGEEGEQALEQLPPDVRRKVEEAMKSGQVKGDAEITVTREEVVATGDQSLDDLPPHLRERAMKKIADQRRVSAEKPPIVARESRGCLSLFIWIALGILAAAAVLVIR